MKHEFYVGQRVLYGSEEADLKGTIVSDKYFDDLKLYGVRFDKRGDQFHDLGGLCENGHGWWCSTAFLRPLDEDPEPTQEYVLGSAEVLYV